ncbi:hypothetical protein HYU18_01105 [Candidatus Woesearchaeota archaeon]|nr:hypothetical protein [Candidatus Woesearchaeota archaeon]
MTIAGLTFSRMLVEKKAASRGQVSINTNIGIVSAEEIDFVMGNQKQKGIKIVFDFRNTYTPDLGLLILNGDVLYLSDQKKHDELMKEWNKSKKFPDEIMAQLYDAISIKSMLQAIQLSSTVGLPPPIPIPRFSAGTHADSGRRGPVAGATREPQAAGQQKEPKPKK